MTLIAELPYYKIERIITGTEQKTMKQLRKLKLYADHIQTRYRIFSLRDVHDLSFRSLGEEGGILFIHTNHGVYSYTVPHDPAGFLQAYQLTVQRLR